MDAIEYLSKRFPKYKDEFEKLKDVRCELVDMSLDGPELRDGQDDSDVIKGMFFWKATPQGHDFWEKVALRPQGGHAEGVCACNGTPAAAPGCSCGAENFYEVEY